MSPDERGADRFAPPPSKESHTEQAAPELAPKSGLARLVAAFQFSAQGFGAAYRHEEAFRQEVWAAAILVPLILLLPLSLGSTLYLLASIFAVMIVELLNSALEWTVDYISLKRHPYAKRIKDMASAAVLMSIAHCGLALLIVIGGWAYPHLSR
ncbi:MAG: diacylglycerol kinase [Puniceicoccaceae bacterium 5H]|nr:MAG: diacylglycerol kinase [Puniceicoccaceae bacterium 5H]